jgi:transglutaminase-like putative cysteine protease
VRISLDWQSTYRYSEPVRLLHTELRVLPADRFGQRRRSGSLTLTPSATTHALTDNFGNDYHHVDFLEEVDHITVQVQAEIDTEIDETAGDAKPDGINPLLRHLYLEETGRAPFDQAIAALADPVPTDLDPVATGNALNTLIGERFTFEVGTTDVAATALDLLRVERGVCQDFSHLMLAALRLRGIPARYVSGYLAPHEGEEAAEASHAWVQLFDGKRWHGFDPANDCPEDGRYVITAVGRDYDDVPPIRGTFSGMATEEWRTHLRVRSQGQQQ